MSISAKYLSSVNSLLARQRTCPLLVKSQLCCWFPWRQVVWWQLSSPTNRPPPAAFLKAAKMEGASWIWGWSYTLNYTLPLPQVILLSGVECYHLIFSSHLFLGTINLSWLCPLHRLLSLTAGCPAVLHVKDLSIIIENAHFRTKTCIALPLLTPCTLYGGKLKH